MRGKDEWGSCVMDKKEGMSRCMGKWDEVERRQGWMEWGSGTRE